MNAGDDGAALPVTATHLARMLQFGDSVFPIGGFAFSGGLESAIQKGVVRDPATLLAFTRTAVEQASRGDGIGLVCAHRAARAGDIDEVVRIDALIYARKLSGETRTMSVRMGRKFTEMGAHVTDSPATARLARTCNHRDHARLLSGGARGQLRRPGSIGARCLRRPPVRRGINHPWRRAAPDARQPHGHAADALRAQRRRRFRLCHCLRGQPLATWPALRRSRRSSPPSMSRRMCGCS